MLSSANEPLQIRSRLHFSQCSQPTPSQALNNAFGNCNLTDSSQFALHSQLGAGSDVCMSQSQTQSSQQDGGRASNSMQPQSSQANGLGSQDFVTPVDQAFETEPSVGGKKMRSPGRLTPKGNKRQRSLLGRGSQGSQGPPLYGGSKSCRDVRHSPRCAHNAFASHSEPQVSVVAKRLPTVVMYREVFKEIRMLGQGNFSKVFHVRNRVDGLEYAIKRSKMEISSSEETLRRQWFQEIQALAASGVHEHIVRYYFAWLEEQAGRTHFYVQLEKCEGSLGQRFSVERKPFKEAELVDILKQLVAALQHLHGLGIAHMDVKPDNVYLAGEGSYKLGDFGLATSLRSQPSIDIEEGDNRYLSPEVLNSDYSQLEKADVFALGATMYQLATGVDLPTGGEQYMNIRKGKLKLIPGCSNSFQTLLKQMLSYAPQERPSTKQILNDKLFKKQATYNQLDLRPSGN